MSNETTSETAYERNEFRGTKYSADLTRVAIAKLVRADIKAAMATGAIPSGTKTNVRCAPRGKSIWVTISAFPGQVLNRAWVFANAAHAYEARPRMLYSAQVRAACDVLEAILRDYLRDASDIQSDYFNVNFYWSVTVDTENECEREELLRSSEFADFRIAKAAGANVTGQLDAYDTSGERTLDD